MFMNLVKYFVINKYSQFKNLWKVPQTRKGAIPVYSNIH